MFYMKSLLLVLTCSTFSCRVESFSSCKILDQVHALSKSRVRGFIQYANLAAAPILNNVAKQGTPTT